MNFSEYKNVYVVSEVPQGILSGKTAEESAAILAEALHKIQVI